MPKHDTLVTGEGGESYHEVLESMAEIQKGSVSGWVQWPKKG